ncbi:hypothetical protein [Rhodoferax ferrireducens]|uniref:hypothetical protein n=1 Tax=Rhodoferax ferrireducens TaxID=192843 RepID=UPI0013001E7E|nr:hypothetical protein [Rhodoferax ferrireducens]
MSDSFKLLIGAAATLAILVFAEIVAETKVESIAERCDKVGAFYVGDKVYDCKLKP